MSREGILLIEDDKDILELVEYNLSKEGYQVKGVVSGEEALRIARSQLPGLILLDIMLPDLDGLEICKILKNDPKTSHIPIVMLTAKGEESDIVAGLELGADDYITKPFSIKVLIARVRTVLRRKPSVTGDDSPIRIGNMQIHPGRHEVMIDEERVDLTLTEYRILHFLARRPGWVFTRSQIVNAVRGDDYPVTDRSVDVQIAGLRKKLGPFGSHIETVRGIGYRFKE
ncbi:MAG: response regulator [candidate division Zixibacteria bacterium]|nr:response regulator [candidate division Zixibacteria bacterium]